MVVVSDNIASENSQEMSNSDSNHIDDPPTQTNNEQPSYEESEMTSIDPTPPPMEKHLDSLKYNEGTGLLLVSSSLTARYWRSSLWFYEDPLTAPTPTKYTAALSYKSGISDTQWVTDSLVFTASDNGSVGVYSINKEKKIFDLEWELFEHDDRVTGLDVCSNTVNGVSVSADGNVKIWDIPAQQSLNRYRGHYDSITSVSCHHTESDVFLTASQDGHVILWDKRKLRPALRLDTAPLEYKPCCVKWQPISDMTFAVADISGSLIVKDLRSTTNDQLTHHSTPHQRPVTVIAFNPSNPSLLATGSEDCTLVVTDITSGESQYKDSSHTDFIKGCIWNNQETLLTCSWDSTIKTHHITS